MTVTLTLPTLNYRRRIAALVWLRRVVMAGLGVALVFLVRQPSFWLLAILVLGLLLRAAGMAWEQSLRRQFIRDAEFPRFLRGKLLAAHPELKPRDVDLVLRGLRQFFMAHLRSKRQFVAMPSKVVDTAWHEFILHTQGYQRWCQAAFGGLLHHTPAEVLGRDPKRNDGLRRTWFWACKEESIDPRHPSRLPLLFALDGKFGIPGGFRYQPDCRDINRQSGSGSYCGTSFSDAGGDAGAAGDAQGLGGSDASAGDASSSDASDGSGCGGGCGGGGD